MTKALYFTGEQEVTIRNEPEASPQSSEVAVQTIYSGISPGTELLIYNDEAPRNLSADASLTTINGDLSYPTKYGYAAVGKVTKTGEDVDSSWVQKPVFVFHPHQTEFCVDVSSAIPIPSSVDLETATMLPSVETATNFLLDSEPKIGERAVVFGAGVIGLCTVQLLSQFPLESLIVVEPVTRRQELARKLGADEAIHPDAAETYFDERDSADVIYEVSGQPAALDDALVAAGYDSRIVVGSWYGEKRHPVDLGRDFHRDRISIISSQVSTLSPELRGRWTTDRRLSVAMRQLTHINASEMITDYVSFQESEKAYKRLNQTPESTLQVVLTYT